MADKKTMGLKWKAYILLDFTYKCDILIRRGVKMNTKLTLMLDNTVINKAKNYAKFNKTSLSKMIESYFKSILESKSEETAKLPTITKELTGMIKSNKKVSNYKKVLVDALSEKHL